MSMAYEFILSRSSASFSRCPSVKWGLRAGWGIGEFEVFVVRKFFIERRNLACSAEDISTEGLLTMFALAPDMADYLKKSRCVGPCDKVWLA